MADGDEGADWGWGVAAAIAGGLWLLSQHESDAESEQEKAKKEALAAAAATRARMRSLAFEHRKSPPIRRFVGDLLKDLGPDRIARAEKIFEWVRDKVNYLYDPGGEHVSAPLETLWTQAGDCDCKATLLATLLEADGMITSFVFVPGHVLVQVLLDGKALAALRARPGSTKILSRAFARDHYWIPLDPTAPGAPMAWVGESTRSAVQAGLVGALVIDEERLRAEFPEAFR